MNFQVTLCGCVMMASSVTAAGDRIDSFAAETEYQKEKQEIRVLLPDSYDPKKQYRVLYVLPVETGFNQQYGYPLGVFRNMNAHNEYDLIIVQMGFEKEPWFGDHATDPQVRQAGYLKEYVVPFIEGKYSTMKTPEGRLLFGFSKSGWGAFSLVLRYPDFFGYAAAWDAPILFDKFQFGMQQVYGTQEQLDKFRPDLLISRQKGFFQAKPRLVLTGETFWGKMIPAPGGGSHTVKTHQLLDKEQIPHAYNDHLKIPHRWDKAWMGPTLKALMQLTGNQGYRHGEA